LLTDFYTNLNPDFWRLVIYAVTLRYEKEARKLEARSKRYAFQFKSISHPSLLKRLFSSLLLSCF
ncbi:MAG: hypothetical protein II107_08120, partial [Prevotella sp.]|nr:hypothetical protein [Prevotella sp.]